MLRVLSLLLLLAQPLPAPAITAPQPGDVLRGAVNVTGSSAVEGFVSAEIAFAYASDPTGTWFLIAASDAPVSDGLLAVWDTTGLSDGDYDLRLRVVLQDGATMDAIVSGLRVRNYTALPTETSPPPPISTTQPPTPAPATVTATLYPTPTPFPANPAALQPAAIYASLGRGALTIGLLFIVFGLLLRLRRR